MKSYYFDYNSTAPLSKSVKNRLSGGALDFLNPSAQHAKGREALKQYHDVSSYLLSSFSLNDSHYIFYHSGATEGINTVFSSHIKLNENPALIIFETDHASVKNTAKSLQGDCKLVTLKPDSLGNLPLKALKQVLNELDTYDILLNWTWSHNETGVVWPLSLIQSLKQQFNFDVHIDAAQVVSKVDGWSNPLASCDYITFSGHKFGALKGSGFTFVNTQKSLQPLIYGGGQQSNLRSGTVNILGVLSLKDALSDIYNFNLDFKKVKQGKDLIMKKVLQTIGDHGEIACLSSDHLNNNTFYLILNDYASDRSFPLFDIAGLLIGKGAACSSGAKKPSESLLALGYKEKASHGLRFSFSPYELLEKSDIYAQKICEVLERVIN